MQNNYRLQDRFGYRISRLSKLMQARLDAQLDPHDVTRLKWCVLSGVALEGYASPSELAENIGITRPAISRLLKAMVADGLIKRNLTEKDGRSREIQLTQAGQDKLAVCLPLVEENQMHFLNKLSAKECQGFDHALEKLILGETGTFDAI